MTQYKVPSLTIAPTNEQNWADVVRPGPHDLSPYWNDTAQLHAHWIERSGTTLAADFAGIDEWFQAWSPSDAHRKDKRQDFANWSVYDTNGERIVQVPYFLRAICGTEIDVAMEALRTLANHLYHQGTTAGGVSLILPIISRIISENLTLLSGSARSLLSLASQPHVRSILPNFIPPPKEGGDEVRSYRFPD